MAKIRKISSIENGVAEVIKILSEDEIEEAIGNCVSFLRKCSDPDQPQHIEHNDSIKLDLACIKKKKFSFKVKISTKKYIEMIKNRYISTLLSMSNNQILKGIDEINYKYRKVLIFNDKLICLILNK